MSETNRLSPMTSYYLRKFLEDKQSMLRGLLPDIPGEITLDRLFERMVRQGKSIDRQIGMIESLVNIHKSVTRNASPDSMEVINLNQRLFSSLGIEGKINRSVEQQESVSAVKDCLEMLNSLHTKALFFLGATISTKYLLASRPEEKWLQKFQLAPNSTLKYDGQLDELLRPEQVNSFEKWVDQYCDRCSHIMGSFKDGASSPGEALFDNML